jgi:hypothetical protein
MVPTRVMWLGCATRGGPDDPHARDVNGAPASDHSFGLGRGEPSAHKLNHLLDPEAMGDHDRLGAAVPAGGEQFERAAAVGLGGWAASAGRGHGWLDSRTSAVAPAARHRPGFSDRTSAESPYTLAAGTLLHTFQQRLTGVDWRGCGNRAGEDR